MIRCTINNYRFYGLFIYFSSLDLSLISSKVLVIPEHTIISTYTVFFSFSPTLTSISQTFKFSETLAGVTLLTFANGAPDILASIFDPDKDSEMLFTEVFGSNLFVLCGVGGILAIFKPFKVLPNSYLKDTLFLFLSVFIVLAFQADEFYIRQEAILTVVIYLFYIVVVVCGHFIQITLKKKWKMKAISVFNIYKTFAPNQITGLSNMASKLQRRIDNIHSELKVRLQCNANYNEEPNLISEINADNHFHLSTQYFMEFLKNKFMTELRKNYKIYYSFKKINELILHAIIPQFDLSIEKQGWNKFLNIIHLFTMPQILSIIALGEMKNFHKNHKALHFLI